MQLGRIVTSAGVGSQVAAGVVHPLSIFSMELASLGGLRGPVRRLYQGVRDSVDPLDIPESTLKVATRVQIPLGLLKKFQFIGRIWTEDAPVTRGVVIRRAGTQRQRIA